MDKIIQTATIQLEQIKTIEENDGVMLLDDKAKETLEYRKKYPEASLKELAEIISLETNKPISWLKSDSAFANTKGGIILFGVDDKTHEEKGIADVVKTTEKI